MYFFLFVPPNVTKFFCADEYNDSIGNGGGDVTEEIYGDVLFIINFSMDFLALFLTGKIMHYKLTAWRIILGASFGALYGVLSLLLPAGFLANVATFGVMLLMCAISFPFGSLRRFAAGTALFAGVSMLIGGIMTAAFVKLGRYQQYIEIGGEIHTVYGDLPVWLFAVLAALSAALTWGIGALIRRRRGVRNCQMKLTFEGKESALDCLVDSGNLLTEPFSGTPVIFVKASAAAFLPDDLLAAMTAGAASLDYRTVGRLRLIPSRTVAGDGMIVAAVPEDCRLGTGGEWESKKALVAVDFTDGDFGGFPALVPAVLL